MLFHDRREAGRQLAEKMRGEDYRDALVLGLPRGGVVVGHELAKGLSATLEVLIIRKLGAPGNPEYGIGAIAETGHIELDHPAIAALGMSQRYLTEETQRQQQEIQRQRWAFRNGQDLPPLQGRRVVLVDDGVATGFTVLAAIAAARGDGVGQLILAIPVAPPGVAERLAAVADECHILDTPDPFMAVGRFYERFDQVSDEEVIACLQEGRGWGTTVRAHLFIAGVVQGVYFRDTARREALQLGLAGWARNHPDGQVEAVFEGAKAAVEEAIRWCHRGPPMAQVEKVLVHWEPAQGEREFSIR